MAPGAYKQKVKDLQIVLNYFHAHQTVKNRYTEPSGLATSGGDFGKNKFFKRLKLGTVKYKA